MDRKTLLIFAKRILTSGSVSKAKLGLESLKFLREQQGANEWEIKLLTKMLDSLPEVQEVAKETAFTEEDVLIAARRAQSRKEMEELARLYGRC